MAQRVWSGQLVYARVPRRLAHRALKGLIAEMVASHRATARIPRPPVGREHVLPRPLSRRRRILAGQREWHPHRAEACVEILSVRISYFLQMRAQRPHRFVRQQGYPTFAPLPSRTRIS